MDCRVGGLCDKLLVIYSCQGDAELITVFCLCFTLGVCASSGFFLGGGIHRPQEAQNLVAVL